MDRTGFIPTGTIYLKHYWLLSAAKLSSAVLTVVSFLKSKPSKDTVSVCVISSVLAAVLMMAWQCAACRDMMTSWNGNAFRVTGPLWGESTGARWIPLTKDQWRSFEVSLVLAEANRWINRWFRTPWCSDDVTLMETTILGVHAQTRDRQMKDWSSVWWHCLECFAYLNFLVSLRHFGSTELLVWRWRLVFKECTKPKTIC